MLVLEEIYKGQKSQYSRPFNLRFQRALSWLKKSTDLDADPDFKLMSLCVAFQALYAEDVQRPLNTVDVFLSQLCQADQGGRILHLTWYTLQQPILWLLHRPYLYAEFWQYQHQKISKQQWQQYFRDEQQQIEFVVQQHNTVALLARIFHCLEMLYQQISQGGMSYQSALYQQYIQESCRVLSTLLPTFMYILLENHEHSATEQPYYPAIQVC